jgi:hypothetical protein
MTKQNTSFGIHHLDYFVLVMTGIQTNEMFNFKGDKINDKTKF